MDAPRKESQDVNLPSGTRKRNDYIFLLAGNIIIGFGIAIFIKANLGVDPFTMFNIGLSNTLNVNFSLIQWIVGFSILGVVFFIDKKKINIGTVANMIMVAPCIEGGAWFLNNFTPQINSLIVSIVVAIIGFIIFSIGIGMYLAANLGIAPYDLIFVILAERTPLSLRVSRIASDGFCFFVGFLLGGPFGLGTILCVFCVGPLIAYFTHKSEDFLNSH
ncbi:hypothetical protein AN639_06195 [Candidatus Epulonipiscium fishelsonii]|uniref:Uncharacterized protein n=1 Tax=Candidatus Epulonipiscium fishelsonii TaxID=77094 RepID=A0ACC8X9T8_9FIRM|nr:hypothetical protein AN396_09750 [Epulopiscium sp. SCG-B11WGA-EpuloA1]ONI39337.1 hypothetical protein AN639_06195 [Epulopiscium sp. SCG-B05WGA-EpuloA1]